MTLRAASQRPKANPRNAKRPPPNPKTTSLTKLRNTSGIRRRTAGKKVEMLRRSGIRKRKLQNQAVTATRK